MKTKLARAAIVAATRLIQDDNELKAIKVDVRGRYTRLPAAVRDAHISIFDADPDISTPKARQKFNDAVDIAADLVNLGLAVQGGRNA
jgi:hypothetical protein